MDNLGVEFFSSSLDQFPAKLAQKSAKLVWCNIQGWTGFIYIGPILKSGWKLLEVQKYLCEIIQWIYITHSSGDCQYNAAKNPVRFNMYALKAQK